MVSVTEEAHRVTLDRAFRGYRTQEVEAFLDELVFAQRAGTNPEQLNELVRRRDFSVVVGGYDRECVERLIESVASSWHARETARQLRAEAEDLHQAVTQTLTELIRALDEASQHLRAIDAKTEALDSESPPADPRR
jgi:DivIVA domain-containing protein